jgi:hypothetical protein
MTTKAPKDDLALERVMPHHRAAWRAERIAWVVGSLTLVAAVLGLFGYGLLSPTTVGTRGVLEVRYDRMQRSSAPTEYEFSAGGGLARDGALHLRFDQGLVDAMEIDGIVPEPERVVAGAGHTEFVFNAEAGPARTAPLRIVFRFRPTTFGHVSGRVAAPGAPPVLLDQFVYP